LFLRGIENWTASSLSFCDGTRGSGKSGLGGGPTGSGRK